MVTYVYIGQSLRVFTQQKAKLQNNFSVIYDE